MSVFCICLCFRLFLLYMSLMSVWRDTLPQEASSIGGSFSSGCVVVVLVDVVAVFVGFLNKC